MSVLNRLVYVHVRHYKPMFSKGSFSDCLGLVLDG